MAVRKFLKFVWKRVFLYNLCRFVDRETNLFSRTANKTSRKAGRLDGTMRRRFWRRYRPEDRKSDVMQTNFSIFTFPSPLYFVLLQTEGTGTRTDDREQNTPYAKTAHLSNPKLTSTVTPASFPTPPVAWLSLTSYMHEWLFSEYGGDIKLYGKPVLSIAHIPEAKELLRKQTQDDIMEDGQTRWSLSAMRMDFLQHGVELGIKGAGGLELTREQLGTFLPIECPKMALTPNGVLRPWTRQISFGQKQAFALTKLLRGEFWNAVGEYEKHFKWPQGAEHTTIAMTEAFCQDTGTPDIYADDLRREWQRQCNTLKMRK